VNSFNYAFWGTVVAGHGIVYLVLVDFFLFAVGSANALNTLFANILEGVILLKILRVMSFKVKESCLVLLFRMVSVAEEVQYVSEFFLDIFHLFFGVSMGMCVGNSCSGLSRVNSGSFFTFGCMVL
jgi:hypothetical protein